MNRSAHLLLKRFRISTGLRLSGVWGAAFVGLLCVSACAPTIWQRAGNADSVSAALRRVKPSTDEPLNASHAPLVYLTLSGAQAPRLMALDLAAKRARWAVPANVTGRVVPGRTMLVHAEPGHVVARNVDDGRERWRFPVPPGQTLVGYAIDGELVFVVFRSGNELRGGSGELLGLDGSNGAIRWRGDLGSANVAAPVAQSGLVAVPNRSQFVSLFDSQSGAPLADVLSKEQAADFVTASKDGFFYGFGSDGVFHLSTKSAVGVRNSPEYFRAHLPNFPAFVRPNYGRDMYRTELLDYSALDRNRVLWRVNTEPEPAHFEDDAVVLLNYRFLFSFEAATARLRWAYCHPAVEAVGATHDVGRILFVTADGHVVGLDTKTGQSIYDFRLAGEVVRGATFDSRGANLPATMGEATAGPSGSLPEALLAMIRDPDRRFAEVKMFALEEMKGVPGREVTAALIGLMANADMPAQVRQKAGQILVARKDVASADLLVEALRVHSDKISGTKPVGLISLAAAAGSIKAKDAVPLLVEHLALPETDPASAAAIIRALATIGDDSALPAVRDYLAQYRTEASRDGEADAVMAAADVLMASGRTADREFLFFVSEAPKTSTVLRDHIRRGAGTTRAPAP